jgi:choline transport protein
MLSSLVIGMVLLAYPDAEIGKLWHVTLLMMLWLILMVGFNIFLAQHLPLAEGIVLVLHVFAFFAFLILFWTMAERSPAEEVFTTWTNGGEWSSMGVSALVGLSTPLWCFIGPDAGAHMSEELKDASVVLPKAMMWAVFFNGIFGCIMVRKHEYNPAYGAYTDVMSAVVDDHFCDMRRRSRLGPRIANGTTCSPSRI